MAVSRLSSRLRRTARWVILPTFLLGLTLYSLTEISKLPINKYTPTCIRGFDTIEFSGRLRQQFLLLLVSFFSEDGLAIDTGHGQLFVSQYGEYSSLSEMYLNGEDKIARTLAGGIIINGIHYPTPPRARKLIKDRWEGREYQKKLAETLAREGEHTIFPTDVDYFIRDCAIKRALVMEPEEPVPPDGLPDLRFLASVRPLPEETLSITILPPEDAGPQPYWIRWLQAW